MKLIVGLGNPGKEYENTRHNIGFMAIDRLANHLNLEVNQKKLNGLYNTTIINGEKVILLKPQKFINLSGDVIREYMDYFKIDKEDILIICDDMDTELGEYRLRYKGSSAGHNGLKNIENNLKTNEYKRIKIGISKNNIDKVNYVLGKLSIDESKKINDVLEKIPAIIDDYLILSYENLMNKYN